MGFGTKASKYKKVYFIYYFILFLLFLFIFFSLFTKLQLYCIHHIATHIACFSVCLLLYKFITCFLSVEK